MGVLDLLLKWLSLEKLLKWSAGKLSQLPLTSSVYAVLKLCWLRTKFCLMSGWLLKNWFYVMENFVSWQEFLWLNCRFTWLRKLQFIRIYTWDFVFCTTYSKVCCITLFITNGKRRILRFRMIQNTQSCIVIETKWVYQISN